MSTHSNPDAVTPAALFTAKQAADYLNVSENMVRKLAYMKELPHIKMGTSLRFLPSDLDAFVMRSRIEAS